MKTYLVLANLLLLCLLFVACKNIESPIHISPIGHIQSDHETYTGFPKPIGKFIRYEDDYYYFDVEALREQCHDIEGISINLFTFSMGSPSEEEEQYFAQLGRVPMVVVVDRQERLGG